MIQDQKFASLPEIIDLIEKNDNFDAKTHFSITDTNLFDEIHFNESLSLIEKKVTLDFLRFFKVLSKNQSVWSHQIIHPRHDEFLLDLELINPLLPENFSLFKSKGISMDDIEVSYVLDPIWQQSVEQNEMTYEDIPAISKQANNVIQKFQIKSKLNLSNWQTTAVNPNFLTKDMIQQMNEQLEAAKLKNDLEKIQVIEEFLKKAVIHE